MASEQHLTLNLVTKADPKGLDKTIKGLDKLKKKTDEMKKFGASAAAGGKFLGDYSTDINKFSSAMDKVFGKTERFRDSAAKMGRARQFKGQQSVFGAGANLPKGIMGGLENIGTGKGTLSESEHIDNAINSMSSFATKAAVVKAITGTKIDGFANTVKSAFSKIGSAVYTSGGKLINFAKKTKDSFSKVNNTSRITFMALMSIMFVAQSVASTFGGMVNSVLKMTGITELFSAVLITIFAPILKELIGWLTNLAKWFMELPEDQRELIAKTIILAAAFGTALTVVAQLAMFFVGLKIAGIGVTGIFIALALAAGLLFLNLVADSDNANENIKSAFDSAGVFVEGLFVKLDGIVGDFFQNMMNLDWLMIWTEFFNFSELVGTKVVEFMGSLWGKIKELGAIIPWEQIWDKFLAFSGKVATTVVTFMSAVAAEMLKEAGKPDNWTKIFEKIFDYVNVGATAVGTFLGNVVVDFLAEDWKDVGVTIMTELIKGFSNILAAFQRAFWTSWFKGTGQEIPIELKSASDLVNDTLSIANNSPLSGLSLGTSPFNSGNNAPFSNTALPNFVNANDILPNPLNNLNLSPIDNGSSIIINMNIDTLVGTDEFVEELIDKIIPQVGTAINTEWSKNYD